MASTPARGQAALVVSYARPSREKPSHGTDVDLGPLVQPVAEALANLSPRWDAQLAADLDREFGAPPSSIDSATLADYSSRCPAIAQRLDLGEMNAAKGAETLEGFRRTLTSKQGSLASSLGFDSTTRGVYYCTLLTLARTYARAHRYRQATDCMTALIRDFPERRIDPSKDEDVLVELYRRVKSTFEQQPRTSIRVITTTPAKLYADGRRVEASFPALRGDYLIFGQTSSSGSTRVHRVAVTVGEAGVMIDVPFEVALQTERVIGWRFDNYDQQRQYERTFAATLCERLILSMVIVLAQGDVNGAPELRLTAYEASGKVLASVSTKAKAENIDPPRAVGLAHELLAKMEIRSPTPTVNASPPASHGQYAKLPPSERYLAEANDYYKQDQYDEAIRAARQSAHLAGRNKDLASQAWRIAGAAACMRRQKQVASEAWRQLEGDARMFVQYICGRQMITLP
jgi:hypothetical protein